MSMRIEHLLISLIALLLGFLLLFSGVILIFSPQHFLEPRAIGVVSLSLGALLLLLFYLVSRRRYLLLEMGGASIDEKLVSFFARQTLEELFPNRAIDCTAILHKKGKVEILANIPYLSDESRETMLNEIETRLAAALLKFCGSKEAFIFNVSFS